MNNDLKYQSKLIVHVHKIMNSLYFYCLDNWNAIIFEYYNKIQQKKNRILIMML